MAALWYFGYIGPVAFKPGAPCSMRYRGLPASAALSGACSSLPTAQYGCADSLASQLAQLSRTNGS
jgi:hypothetical protein